MPEYRVPSSVVIVSALAVSVCCAITAFLLCLWGSISGFDGYVGAGLSVLQIALLGIWVGWDWSREQVALGTVRLVISLGAVSTGFSIFGVILMAGALGAPQGLESNLLVGLALLSVLMGAPFWLVSLIEQLDPTRLGDRYRASCFVGARVTFSAGLGVAIMNAMWRYASPDPTWLPTQVGVWVAPAIMLWLGMRGSFRSPHPFENRWEGGEPQ